MRLRARRIVLESAFAFAATVAATASWWATYQDLAMVVMVVVTAAIGVAIGGLGARFRWNSVVVLLAMLVAYLAVGVPLAVPSTAFQGVLPTLEGERELLVSTALGWKQLVTITVPVGSYQGLLVPLFVLVLVSSVVSVTVALRASARFADLAVFVPWIVFVTGIAFGSDLALLPRAGAIVVLLVSVGWLVVRHRTSRSGPVRVRDGRIASTTAERGTLRLRLQSVVSGIAILIVAGAAATLLSGALPPAGAREVIRTSIDQPFDPRDYTSPLATYRSYLDDGARDEVMLTIDGLPRNALVRIATLDAYDGVVYSVGSGDVDSASGYFTRVPYRFDQSGASGARAELHVAVGAYSGVWLPTVGATESIDFTGGDTARLRDAFYFNASSGTAADTALVQRGDEYTISAIVPEPRPADQLAGLEPGSADVPAIGVIPDELDVRLADYTKNAATPGARLEAMIEGLQANGYLSDGDTAQGEEPSRSGHSADRITELLTDSARMIGDAEQYAVTAAIMARQLGFPARVVFGFAPNVTPGEPTQVHGSDVSAWIEVDTASSGWVSIDPNPTPRDIPKEDSTPPASVSRPPSIVQPPVAEPPATQQQAPPESSQNPVAAPDPWLAVIALLAGIVLVAIVILVLVGAPFLTVVLLKARRRRRRRTRGEPRDRVRAGWREFEDAAVDHRLQTPPAATRTEFARGVGAPAGVLLARVADRAAFAPESLDDADAARVWATVDELRAALDRRVPRRARWAARVSLRSLRGGRRS